MRITTLTGTCTLLLAGSITLTQILPALNTFVVEASPPIGTVAGVSLGGVVEATPTNTLYAELQEQQKSLDQKEKELVAREAYMNRYFAPTPGTMKFLYALIAGLFLLVIINFAFDIRRHYQNRPRVQLL